MESPRSMIHSHPGRALAVAGVGLVSLAAAGALVSSPPASWEVGIFRSFNELPHNIEWVLWALQQMGSAVVVPFAAIVLWRITRRWQPPVALIGAGFLLGWVGAKGIKAIVGRGRPGAILDNVVLGFDVPVAELGFPSGHAVLAFTLAIAFAPYLGRRGRILALGLAALVAVTRIYVGAHLPLDVVGGAGYGIAIGVVAIWAARYLGATSPRIRAGTATA